MLVSLLERIISVPYSIYGGAISRTFSAKDATRRRTSAQNESASIRRSELHSINCDVLQSWYSLILIILCIRYFSVIYIGDDGAVTTVSVRTWWTCKLLNALQFFHRMTAYTRDGRGAGICPGLNVEMFLNALLNAMEVNNQQQLSNRVRSLPLEGFASVGDKGRPYHLLMLHCVDEVDPSASLTPIIIC
ncbi:hypothetical protein J6590_037791 [Homalodisca vitripennis]|nr:hypothetical protein J6590_037791 [Homalodisca vitripennis]